MADDFTRGSDGVFELPTTPGRGATAGRSGLSYRQGRPIKRVRPRVVLYAICKTYKCRPCTTRVFVLDIVFNAYKPYDVVRINNVRCVHDNQSVYCYAAGTIFSFE